MNYQPNEISTSHTQAELKVAQITDCHLFADVNGQHCGANVYLNLLKTLHAVKAHKPDLLIFTGDLTQDHTAQSYQRFVEAFKQTEINFPCYFLLGNHDDAQLMNEHLSSAPFQQDKTIESAHWQLVLLQSKSETPAGFFQQAKHQKQFSSLSADKNTFAFMHHHPIDVGYFIDRHNLQNADEFWQAMQALPNVKGVACGHVHNALQLSYLGESSKQSIPLYTCPATSIQFDPQVDGVGALPLGAGFRIFEFFASSELKTHVVFLES